MATNNMVPYSNPQGNNQTTPGAGSSPMPAPIQLPGASGGSLSGILPASSGASSANPLVPAGTASTQPANQSSNQTSLSGGAFGGQLNDIYGATGAQIGNFLGSIAGTDSAITQEYIKSLQPQMAAAQANTNAALGAGGVSANSSVAALADANLQSNEFASIAGEEAKLTDQQMQMTGNMLESIAPEAAHQTADDAAMPWEIMGSVLGSVPGLSGLGSGLSSVGSNMADVGQFGGSGGGSSVPMQGFDGGDASMGGW